MEIMENMLFQMDGKTVKVVFCNRLSSIIHVINMEDGKKWSYPMEKDTVISRVENGEISILKEDPYYRYIIEEEMSDAEKKRRDRAWEMVSHVLQQFEQKQHIYLSKYRQKAIHNTVATFQVNYNTIKSYLIEYLRGGKVRNALLPTYYKCGATGQIKKESEVKRGRPRKYGEQVGVNIDDKTKKVIKNALNRYYYNQKQNTLKTAYELMIKDFFTAEKVEQNGLVVPVLQTNIPTYHQFLYWYKSFNVNKLEISKRQGSRVFHQRYRAIIGDSTQDAGLGPGTLWQTDSTPLDIFCVSSTNRSILVGKPLLHLVVDVYSRLIVGFSLSFESLNSYSGAMVALLNSMTSKKEFCKKYGIDVEDKWDVACIPMKIFTDRGELNGLQIESAIEGLGIAIQNSPSYRPETKGIIEQALNQIQLRLTPHIDGALINRKRVRERGESDFRLKANLTIDEVTAIIIRSILFHNNHHVLSDYGLTEDMLAEGIEKIPMKIWQYGIKHQKGQLRSLPEDVIKMHLLPNDSATITAQGVRFRKMLFASEYSLQQNWFQTARIGGSSRIKIWFDPRDLSQIFTLIDDGKNFHTLGLLDHLTKYKRKSIEEIDQINQYEREVDSKGKEIELQEKIKLFDEIEKIVAHGRAETVAERDDSVSKSSRLKGIKVNQRRERELQRELINMKEEIEDEYVQDDPVFVETKDDDDQLSLFRQLSHINKEESR